MFSHKDTFVLPEELIPFVESLPVVAVQEGVVPELEELPDRGFSDLPIMVEERGEL
jgi:hypothetical protein